MLWVTLLSQSKNTDARIFAGLVSASPQIDFPKSSEDGSGLLYRDSTFLYLITARHNILQKEEFTDNWALKYDNFDLVQYEVYDSVETSKRIINIDTEFLFRYGFILFDRSGSVDIAALLLGTLYTVEDEVKIKYIPEAVKIVLSSNQLLEKSQVTYVPQNIATANDIYEGNEIYMIGYPSRIGIESLSQYDYNRPMIRRGIISQRNLTKNTIIIDAASYPGNSGSPVVQFVEGVAKIVGILTETIEINPKGRYVGNSGYSVVVPMDNILKIIADVTD